MDRFMKLMIGKIWEVWRQQRNDSGRERGKERV